MKMLLFVLLRLILVMNSEAAIMGDDGEYWMLIRSNVKSEEKCAHLHLGHSDIDVLKTLYQIETEKDTCFCFNEYTICHSGQDTLTVKKTGRLENAAGDYILTKQKIKELEKELIAKNALHPKKCPKLVLNRANKRGCEILAIVPDLYLNDLPIFLQGINLSGINLGEEIPWETVLEIRNMIQYDRPLGIDEDKEFFMNITKLIP